MSYRGFPSNTSLSSCLAAEGIAVATLRCRLSDVWVRECATQTTVLLGLQRKSQSYDHLQQLNSKDITIWKKEMADLTGIQFAGFDPNS